MKITVDALNEAAAKLGDAPRYQLIVDRSLHLQAMAALGERARSVKAAKPEKARAPKQFRVAQDHNTPESAKANVARVKALHKDRPRAPVFTLIVSKDLGKGEWRLEK